jgi:hypothetical protein
MAYAQINFPQKLGNSNLTIAEAGCFCTADANLLESVGVNVDPATLNQFYIDHGVYLYDATDRANDDLFWGSAGKYDGRMKLVSTGVSGWPSSNLAEVRFHYQSISHPWLDAGNTRPNMITHFCKVDDWASQLIVDSWDGKVKSPGAYGQPTGWAIFEFQQPAPPPPVEVPVVVAPVEPVAPPALPYAPVVAPSTAPYVLVKDVLGYGTATNAGNHVNPVADLPEGDYYVFNTYPNRPDLINVTKTAGRPGDTTTNQGGWINTADNVIVPEVVVPPPVLPPANYGGVTRTDTSTPIVVETPPLPTPPPLETAPAPTIVTPPVTNTNAWKTTNSPLQLDRQVQWFESRNNQIIQIHDLDQKGSAVPLKPYTAVPLVSVFEKDGIRYGRTQKVANAGLWYGVPMNILVPENDIFGTAKTIAERAFTHSLKLSDGPAIMLGKLERFIDGIKQTRRK